MPLNIRFIEKLLSEDEGPLLDFKTKQYAFVKASIPEKVNLLKDILSFANADRQSTAYVLIGVQEVKGGRSKVTGVDQHLEDASLHQFVNGKTQRPITFLYRTIQIEGKTLGVIEIPLQERPIYLTKSFGSIGKNEVFIRDGSSNRIATPEEISRMGQRSTTESNLLSVERLSKAEFDALPERDDNTVYFISDD